MKIIIEGIDCVGKTSQIENIINYFSIPFIKVHSYAPSKALTFKDEKLNFEEELYKNTFEIIKSTPHIIFDRAHLGVKVYGSIYRFYDKKDTTWIDELETDIADDVILITLIDDAEQNIARDKVRGDGKTFTHDVKKKQHEIDLFVKAFNESKIKHKKLIDISKVGDEQLVFSEIITFIREKQNVKS